MTPIPRSPILLAVACVAFTGEQSLGLPTGAHWELVPNNTNLVPNNTNLAGVSTNFASLWRTFDLFVDLEAGDAIAASDFGIAEGNSGLSTDGSFYFAPAPGTDDAALNIGFAGFIPDLEFCTAVTSNGFAVSTLIYTRSNPLYGAWVRQDSMPSSGPSVWLARITVSADATFLGGQIYVSGIGPNGDFGGVPFPGTVDLPALNPSAYPPTPGAVALLGIGGIGAMRRRRRSPALTHS